MYLCHVITNTCLPRISREWESQVQQLLKSQNNKQMLPNVLWIFSFFEDRGLIEDGALGPQAEESDIIMVSCALEDALPGKNIIKVLSDDIDVLVLPVYLCHGKALRCKFQMQSWDSTPLDINVTLVELNTNGLQMPGMHFLNGCNTTSCPYWKDQISVLNIPSIRIFVGLHDALGEVDATQAGLMEFRKLIFTALYGQSLGIAMAMVQVIYQKPNQNHDPAQKLFPFAQSCAPDPFTNPVVESSRPTGTTWFWWDSKIGFTVPVTATYDPGQPELIDAINASIRQGKEM